MKSAIFTSFDKSLPLSSAAPMIRAAGFEVVAIGAGPGRPGYTTPEGRDEIRRLFAEHGLAIDSLHAPFPSGDRLYSLDDGERARRSAADPSWGEMVCRCEQVTRAEVKTALENPFGAETLDAVKRRTRCGMGRCQGGFCTPRIVDILRERGLDPCRITKRGPGSELFFGRMKP